MTIWINGKFVAPEAATISVYDHGLLYGDGIFEGLRAYGGQVFRLNAHLERLQDGARALMIRLPLAKEELAERVREAVRLEAVAGNPDSYIRLLLTRGVGPLGLDPHGCDQPSLVIIVDRIRLYPAEYYQTGVSIISSVMRRNSPDSLDPRIKGLNYLNNILAKIQARQAGAQEAILLNHQGYVAECTGDNLITVKSGKLRLPAAFYGALEGITLAAVLGLAHDLGIPVEQTGLTLYDLYCADEVFLTGTGAELVPVCAVDGRPLPPAGPVFSRLRQEFNRRIAESPEFFT